MKLQYEREIGIGTNKDILRKYLISESIIISKQDEFIEWASRASYNLFGFGYTAADYMVFLWQNKGKKRLNETNYRQWKSISKIIFARDNYTCTYCFKVGGALECDHVVPFSKGGSNDIENLTTACMRCNRQKKDKSVVEFNEWRALKENGKAIY